MATIITQLVCLSLFLLGLHPAFADAQQISPSGNMHIYFSPAEGAGEVIAAKIVGAKQEVLVQACNLTSVPIAKALNEAHKRGVRIEIILDRSQPLESNILTAYLAKNGAKFYVDDKHDMMSNNIVIIDRSTLISGSFGFSKDPVDNGTGNLFVFERNRKLAKVYLENFETHKKHAAEYIGLR